MTDYSNYTPADFDRDDALLTEIQEFAHRHKYSCTRDNAQCDLRALRVARADLNV